MKLKSAGTGILLFFCGLSLFIWFTLAYPQFSFINVSVSRAQALSIAERYVSDKHGIEASAYKTAIVFIEDSEADRYLQKTLGFKEEKDFIKAQDLDLFFWFVRFFRENEKEEFRLAVSAATGEITSFVHTIEDTAARENMDDEAVETTAIQFLKDTFNFNPGQYTLHSKLSKKFDNRTDHFFAWQKKNVHIPWDKAPDGGGAKLLTSVTVSGNEIRVFSKNKLDIPDKFNRHIERQKDTGENLSLVFTIFYLALLSIAIYFVLIRRAHVITHTIRNFYIGLVAMIFLFSLAQEINEFQGVLFRYATTSSLVSYLWHYILQWLIYIVFLVISILMSGLAGESLQYELFPNKEKGSFLHYVRSTFLSRDVFRLVLLGYLVSIIMLGIQAAIFELGRKYFGVWVEHIWITQLSTTYLPFLAAFIIGFKASFTEEITFRIFAISWFRKLTRNSLFAVILASVLWGFGHSQYLVFPMWFRGIEVSFLGLFLSYIYLRHGIIVTIVAHYLFDVFWSSAVLLLGKTRPFDFYSALAMLLLPLLFGMAAFCVRRKEEERSLNWKLNRHQVYNLKILDSFLRDDKIIIDKPLEQVKQELVTHGWDIIVVEEALRSARQKR